MLKAKDIMSAPVISVPEDTSLSFAVKLMAEKNIGSVIVETSKSTLGSEHLGIITERDVIRFIADYQKIDELKVSDVMSTPLITVNVETPVLDVSEKMEEHNIRRLPVVDGTKVVGIVTSRDVSHALRYSRAKWIVEHASEEKL